MQDPCSQYVLYILNLHIPYILWPRVSMEVCERGGRERDLWAELTSMVQAEERSGSSG